MTMKQAITGLIEATENPLAPTIVEEAYNAIERLGKMLSYGPELQIEVAEVSTKLLSAWTDEELDMLSTKPAFTLALAGALAEALKSYVGAYAHR